MASIEQVSFLATIHMDPKPNGEFAYGPVLEVKAMAPNLLWARDIRSKADLRKHDRMSFHSITDFICDGDTQYVYDAHKHEWESSVAKPGLASLDGGSFLDYIGTSIVFSSPEESGFTFLRNEQTDTSNARVYSRESHKYWARGNYQKTNEEFWVDTDSKIPLRYSVFIDEDGTEYRRVIYSQWNTNPRLSESLFQKPSSDPYPESRYT